jgi:DNA processing protein
MGMREEIFYWLGLSLVPGVGAVLYKRLLERFNDPGSVFQASREELLGVEGMGQRAAEAILRGPFEKEVERELYLLQKVNGTLLTLHGEAYPRRLKAIYDPPPLLYVRGAVKAEDDFAIAVVGSRRTSTYGRAITEKLSQDLAAHGITIVSGMARGIDSVAHQGALGAGGRTLAVLGCGVDVIYPPENRRLCEEIIAHGAVLSEFPMGSPPEGSHFPKRNRVISGLSMGVVVVQAGQKSGSLITANCALEQGREVFAVPGNVGINGSSGTNQLIKDGAKLVAGSADILEEVIPQWKREMEEGAREKELILPLSADEKRIYDHLGDDPLHIDPIIRESEMDPGRVLSLLLGLELKGLVLQWPGKCFSRKT